MAQVYPRFLRVLVKFWRFWEIFLISCPSTIVPFLSAKITGIWDASIRDQFREQDAEAPDIRLD